MSYRYSIYSGDSDVDALLSVVRQAGGDRIVAAPYVKLVFADLAPHQAERLRSLGLKVTRVETIRPMLVRPPRQVTGLGDVHYTLDDLLRLMAWDRLRSSLPHPITGEGYVVAVLDSGIRSGHERLVAHVIDEANFSLSATTDDAVDHGTGVASVVTAVAPGAHVLSCKVIGDDGVGDEESVCLAIDDVLRRCASGDPICAINLSLGAPDTGDPSDPLRIACQEAFRQGVFVAAAAGNDGPDSSTINTPACDRLVMAVGSCAPDPFTINEFSSRGPTREGLIKPDIVLFGNNIETASAKGDAAYGVKSGTSYAAPIAAAGAAVAKQVTDYFVAQGIPPGVVQQFARYVPGSIDITAEWELEEGADPFWSMGMISIKPPDAPPGKDNTYGYGVPMGDVIVDFMESQVAPAMVGGVSSLAGGILALVMMVTLARSIVARTISYAS